MMKTPIPKLVFSLAIPTVIGMLITSVYSMVDTYYVTRLGEESTAAIGVVFSVMALIQAIGFAIGMGSGSALSRFLGKQEREEAATVMMWGIAFALGASVFLSAAGLLWLEPMMEFLGASDTVLPYAVDYGRYILLAVPFMILSLVLHNLLRAMGEAKQALAGIALGGILNIVLDPLFIFYLGQEIGGAALATGISQAASFLFFLVCFWKKRRGLSLSLSGLRRGKGIPWLVLRQGFPSFLRQGLASVATVLLNRQARAYGDDAVAALSIAGRVFAVLFSIIIGFGQGSQPVIGYNYGAKKWKRVRDAFCFTLFVETGIMIFVGCRGYSLAENLMSLFMAKNDQVIAIGAAALRWQFATLGFVPLGVVSNMLFQSVGISGKSTFLSACRQGIFFVPLLYILSYFRGLEGLVMTQAVSDVLSALICIPFDVGFLRQIKKKAGQRDGHS
ncbi:MAG: MATE family efflux transporter [Roseburia sp.]